MTHQTDQLGFAEDETDYEFADWDFSGTTEAEFNGLLAIFDLLSKPVYCRLRTPRCLCLPYPVPGMSDIYPAEDLLYANNNMGSHLRDDPQSSCQVTGSKKITWPWFDQLDEEGFDDQSRAYASY